MVSSQLLLKETLQQLKYMSTYSETKSLQEWKNSHKPA